MTQVDKTRVPAHYRNRNRKNIAALHWLLVQRFQRLDPVEPAFA